MPMMQTTTDAPAKARRTRPPGTSNAAKERAARVPSAKKATIPESIADKVIRFIESVCRYPEGKLAGRLVVLPEFHKRAIRGIYAESEPGVFKHHLAIISWPRKQAKTGLMASLLIAHLCGPVAVKNSQMYSCAFSADQAAVIFRYAEKMVQMEPRLSSRIRIRASVKTMICPGTGVTFKALSSDDKTAYGLSPQVTFFDEIGQAGPSYPLWDAMDTAKGAVHDPLTVLISTQSATDDALLSVLIDDASNDPGVFLDLVQCPPDIEPTDTSRLHEWVPGWDCEWLARKEIIKMAQRAARLPSERSRYLNLIANRRVRADAGLFTPDAWNACGGAMPEGWNSGRRKAWGGLDLSVTTDITAWVLIVPMDDGTIAVKCQFFLPEEGIDERALKDRVPYRQWADAGLLTLCPGAVIGYEWVLEQIAADADDYDIQEIAYDRYKMRVLKKAADDAGITLPTMVEHGQGYVSMGVSITELENVVLQKQLRHGDHPIMRNHIANAVIDINHVGDRRFVKKKRTQRIDGAVALAMAVGQWRKSALVPSDTAAMIG